jgi:hypothetical protein
MRSLSSMVLDIWSALLPKTLPIPPRSTLSSMRITKDLSSLTSAPDQSNAPSSPRRKALCGEQLASPSHKLMTGESQIAPGIG